MMELVGKVHKLEPLQVRMMELAGKVRRLEPLQVGKKADRPVQGLHREERLLAVPAGLRRTGGRGQGREGRGSEA